MTARLMARWRAETSDHTDWCARDHRCGLNEHRSEPFMADVPGVGRLMLTRVRSGAAEYAEIHGRVRLHDTPAGARWQVGVVLGGLRRTLAAARLRPGVVGVGAARRAVGGR